MSGGSWHRWIDFLWRPEGWQTALADEVHAHELVAPALSRQDVRRRKRVTAATRDPRSLSSATAGTFGSLAAVPVWHQRTQEPRSQQRQHNRDGDAAYRNSRWSRPHVRLILARCGPSFRTRPWYLAPHTHASRFEPIFKPPVTARVHQVAGPDWRGQRSGCVAFRQPGGRDRADLSKRSRRLERHHLDPRQRDVGRSLPARDDGAGRGVLRLRQRRLDRHLHGQQRRRPTSTSRRRR